MQQLSADGPQSAWPAPPSAQLGGGPESAPRAIHPGATSGAVASLPGAPASCTAEPASSASSWEMLDSIATGAPRASGDGLLSLTAFASTKWLVVLASMADMESTRWGPLPPQPAVTKKADAISPLPVPVPTTPFIKRRIPSRGSSRTGTVGLGGVVSFKTRKSAHVDDARKLLGTFVSNEARGYTVRAPAGGDAAADRHEEGGARGCREDRGG